jgi:arabinan endo-1,5-alpha-L-arabinosidase
MVEINPIRRCCLILAALLLLLGCGPDSEQASAPTVAPQATSAPAPTPAPTSAPEQIPAPTTGALQPAEGEFANPVIDQDFPDPDVLQVGETYYAYATNSGGANIQLATSPDLVRWSIEGDALPALPPWSQPGNTWAPEVSALDGGGYAMYFTARHGESGRQCIGAATAELPEGPFAPAGEQPLICQLELGGSIDASMFVDDDGARYLLWKNDGNCCGQETWIFIQRVSADGLTLEGEPTQLITQDQPWEGRLIEAPTLWKHEGRYYLFYSANSYAGLDYAVGYAVAEAVLGPYQKGEGPLLASDLEGGAAFGPGGQDVVADAEGETWMLYHSWDPTVSYRRLQIDELEWEGETPVLRGPDLEPQPAP